MKMQMYVYIYGNFPHKYLGMFFYINHRHIYRLAVGTFYHDVPKFSVNLRCKLMSCQTYVDWPHLQNGVPWGSNSKHEHMTTNLGAHHGAASKSRP